MLCTLWHYHYTYIITLFLSTLCQDKKGDVLGELLSPTQPVAITGVEGKKHEKGDVFLTLYNYYSKKIFSQ